MPMRTMGGGTAKLRKGNGRKKRDQSVGGQATLKGGRDQTEDPPIDEVEQHGAPLTPELGGVPLPMDRLLRQWEKQQKEERDTREARWKTLGETHRAPSSA